MLKAAGKAAAQDECSERWRAWLSLGRAWAWQQSPGLQVLVETPLLHCTLGESEPSGTVVLKAESPDAAALTSSRNVLERQIPKLHPDLLNQRLPGVVQQTVFLEALSIPANVCRA